MPPLEVLVTSLSVSGPDDPGLDLLRADGHTVRFVPLAEARDPAAFARALRGAAATIASVEPYPAALLAHADSLRVISRTGVGYDAIDLPAATARGIAVCVTPNTNQHAVADLAVGLILAALRAIPAAERWLRDGRWAGSPSGREIQGLTLGVVGTGLIGREVVKRLAGFGPAAILACDIVEDPSLVERHGVRYVSRDRLFAEADVVTLHAPLLPDTRHMVGAALLARMKPDAILVNTARGPLVDEVALAGALREGRLGAAALDVFEQEPLPLDSPLRAVPAERMLLTPHVAGISSQSRARMVRMAAENAARVLRGEPPLACVNPEALSAPTPRYPREP